MRVLIGVTCAAVLMATTWYLFKDYQVYRAVRAAEIAAEEFESYRTIANCRERIRPFEGVDLEDLPDGTDGIPVQACRILVRSYENSLSLQRSE